MYFLTRCNIMAHIYYYDIPPKDHVSMQSCLTALAHKYLMVKFMFCRCYPFYYAPFACDFKCLSQFKVSFTVDKPLRPFDQLMAVLPPKRRVFSCT